MYRQLLKPLLFRLDAETAHDVVFRMAEEVQQVGLFRNMAAAFLGRIPGNLHQNILGIAFPGPVGLAAGFDKNARLIGLLSRSGFGYLEVGSITARPAEGNPRPRSFRLPADEALINRMGLNNEGADKIVRRLAELGYPAFRNTTYPSVRTETDTGTGLRIPVGVNIAKTHDSSITGDAAIEDYARSYALALGVADYVTVNISCPNTADGRTFETPGALNKLLERLMKTGNPRKVPVLVKFSNDIGTAELKELTGICESAGIDGYVATNTATSRASLRTPASTLAAIGNGGLSGAPIRKNALRVLSGLSEFTSGRKPLIGVGGIMTGEDAIERIRAGAWLLQTYTGLVYNGPGFPRLLNRHIASELEKRGLDSLEQLRHT
jgi:dihydroorotate dehydrogenase